MYIDELNILVLFGMGVCT